jgi:hypothetical protein
VDSPQHSKHGCESNPNSDGQYSVLNSPTVSII